MIAIVVKSENDLIVRKRQLLPAASLGMSESINVNMYRVH